MNVDHGYTNDTERSGSVVRKRYRGPYAESRRASEQHALRRLAGRVPVPPLRSGSGSITELGFVDGRHGQDLIDAGHAAAVLHACGAVLRQLQAVDVEVLFPDAVGVVVHGDFGPNNLLFGPELEPVAVLDWEFCHAGDPIEDLAWCEWIVRRHHPGEVASLPSLFGGYGSQPSWSQRHGAMLARCGELEDFCRAWDDDGAGVRQWQQHRATTARWSE